MTPARRRISTAVSLSLVATCLLPALAGADHALGAAPGAIPVTIDIGPGNDVATALAVQGDGRIVVVGTTQSAHDAAAPRDIVVLRFYPDGRLDPTFGDGGKVLIDHKGGDDQAAAVAIQPDGKIVIVGDVFDRGWHQDLSHLTVFRLDAGGLLDTSFDGDGKAILTGGIVDGSHGSAVALQPDGSILAAGDGHLGEDLTRRAVDTVVARFRPDGSRDPAFGEDGIVLTDFDGWASNEYAESVGVLPDGRILVAGNSALTFFAGPITSDYRVFARYLASGELDPTFGIDGRSISPGGGTVLDAVIGPDGSSIVSGRAIDTGGQWSISVARYRSDGTPDPGFGGGGLTVTSAPPGTIDGWTVSNGNSWGSAVAVDARGRIVVAGLALGNNNVDMAVVRYNAAGALDTTFGQQGWIKTDVAGGYDALGAVGLLTDGRIVAVGKGSRSGADQLAFIVYPADPPPAASAWGWNPVGALGDGTTVTRPLPTRVTGLANSQSLTAGAYHTLALDDAGRVQAWGWNAMGQLGIGTTVDRLAPVTLPGLSKVGSVSAGYYHSLATSGGRVWTWGWNVLGQLGDGTTVARYTPTIVPGLTGVVAVSGGGLHSLALKDDGSVWAWGYNGNGQLGDGTTVDRSSPVAVTGLTGVVAISAGGLHNLAIKADGSVWAWGWNGFGELGDGTTIDRHTPVAVTTLTSVVAISAGTYHSLALDADGAVSAWGWNAFGQLGDGSTVNRAAPVRVSGLPRMDSISAGCLHSVALGVDGRVRAWGWNGFGQLGDGTTIERHAPVVTSGPSTVTAVAAGSLHAVALGS